MWDVDGFDEEDAELPRLTSHSSEEWSADDEDDEAAEDTWPPPKPSKVHIEAALRAPRTVEEITAIVTHVGLGLETGAFSSSEDSSSDDESASASHDGAAEDTSPPKRSNLHYSRISRIADKKEGMLYLPRTPGVSKYHLKYLNMDLIKRCQHWRSWGRWVAPARGRSREGRLQRAG